MYKTGAALPSQHGGVTDEPVRFDTRIVLVLREGLEPWQEINVSAFLASGIATDPDLIGETYVDAEGTDYLPMIRQPILVFQGDVEALRGVREKAVARSMRVAVYDAGMFATGHDAANRDVVAAASGNALDLVGVAVHGPKNAVDRIVKGVARHP